MYLVSNRTCTRASQANDHDRCLGLISTDQALARKVNLEYALAAANAFSTHLAPPLANQGKKFRFCYTSGMAAVKDQEKPLWVLQEGRRMRVCHVADFSLLIDG